jgi:hypothetical protein
VHLSSPDYSIVDMLQRTADRRTAEKALNAVPAAPAAHLLRAALEAEQQRDDGGVT